MNGRIVSLARELARFGRPLSLEGLADEYGVSTRTIRNDVKSLNRFLAERGLGQLEYGPGGTIVVPPDFSRVAGSLPDQSLYSYRMSSNERKALAAVMLAEEPAYVTLADIASRFSVSRATTLSDLDGVRAIVREAGLEVVSKPSRGLRVVGGERLRRRLLLEFLLSGSPQVGRWLSSGRDADRADDATIRRVLDELGLLHGAVLDDHAFRVVGGYLTIAVRRCRGGMRVAEGEVVSSARPETRSYARDVVELLSQRSGVEMGAGEVEALAVVLEAIGFRSDLAFSVEDVRVQAVTREFVRSVSEACGVDLNDDYSLFECLSSHLASALSPGASGMPVSPALREVVAEQPRVLEAVRGGLPILEAYAHRRVSDAEVVHVALHICAAVERRRNARRGLRAIVVCDEGVGTAKLIAEDLRGRFGLRVVRTIPAHLAPSLSLSSADLVVSTVALRGCPIEGVVAPLPFSERDYERIRMKVDEVGLAGGGVPGAPDEPGAQGLLDRIEPILRDGLPDGGERIIRQVRAEVWRYFREGRLAEAEPPSPLLRQVLPASHIQLDVEAADWRDAVAKSAMPLVSMGYVEPRYIGAMIENIERNGPYVVFFPHVAIPHEAPGKGARRMGMNLVRLREPVEFGAGDNDPVTYVCTLVPADRTSHLRAFFNLLGILSKPELGVLRELDAASPEEAAAVIESAEWQVL